MPLYARPLQRSVPLVHLRYYVPSSLKYLPVICSVWCDFISSWSTPQPRGFRFTTKQSCSTGADGYSLFQHIIAVIPLSHTHTSYTHLTHSHAYTPNTHSHHLSLKTHTICTRRVRVRVRVRVKVRVKVRVVK